MTSEISLSLHLEDLLALPPRGEGVYAPACLRPYAERYAAAPARPFRVTALLRPASPLALYEPPCLAGLLAAAVVREATAGAGLPDYRPGYDQPLPLRALGRYGPYGLPLWHAGRFEPVGPQAAGEEYWHKRAVDGGWTGTRTGEFSIRSTSGRHMERRVPQPVLDCREWRAEAVGDPEEAARLLREITHLGKHRGTGYGAVAAWRVEEVPEAPLALEGRLRLSLPAEARPDLEAAGLLSGRIAEAPARVGWTPPLWNPALWLPGWYAGTPLAAGPDWLEELPE